MEYEQVSAYKMTIYRQRKATKNTAPWCNGSTAGFDPVGPSSNLGGVTFLLRSDGRL